MQRTFNPANFAFQWTDNWYQWDRKQAHKQALAQRNLEAKALKAQGKRVVNFTLSGQLITRGGIGSGHPEIDLCCSVYGFNVYP